MKSTTALFLAIILSFSFALTAHAQTSESIWLTASTTSFKTGESVTVLVNAASITQIQGFTFQIRYDPACLKPLNAASPISGMNGLGLPQTPGLVDASFASTVPQTANGVLAEVRFEALGGCQTNLILESAALAIRDASGFAAPLPGVKLGESNIALAIDSVPGDPSSQPLQGTPLPLEPGGSAPSGPQTPLWGIALLMVLLIGGLGFGIYKVAQKTTASVQVNPSSSRSAILQFRQGAQAGKSFSLNKLPCLIGRDPSNDICLNDPFVLNQHAKIYTANNGYYLMDLGGETFVNGQAVKGSFTALKYGDVVRLGKKTAFVFGS
jgi:hypothetical protein